jgi:hypothetical protein
MALDEDDPEKNRKLIELRLTEEEWKRVELFLGLLAVRYTYLLSLAHLT